MKNAQTNSTESHGITLRDKLIQLAILTGTIGIAITCVATGISAPLGLVTTSMEMARIAPQFEQFNKTRVGRALKFTADVVFSKPVVRAFKLAVPILGMAGLGIATGGIAPAIALAITCTSMVYKIGREVYELRKTRKIEQQLTTVNAINTAKKVAEEGPLKELQSLGIEIPAAPAQTIHATHHDIQPASKLKTFLKSSAFSLVESTGSVVKAFIGGHPLEEAAASLFTMGGVGKETELTLKIEHERHEMKQKIIASGGKIAYDQDKLKAEEKAQQKYTESLMRLTRDAKTFQLSKDEIQQRFNVINKTLQTELQAPPVKDHILKRVAHQILQVFKDIVEVHKPNISDPRAIFAKDPNDPQYNIDHNSPMHKIEQAQQEKEQYYQRFAQIMSVNTKTEHKEVTKATTQNIVTKDTQQDIKLEQEPSSNSSHTVSDTSTTHRPVSEHNPSQPKPDIKVDEAMKETEILKKELSHSNSQPLPSETHKIVSPEPKLEHDDSAQKPKTQSSTLASEVAKQEVTKEVQTLEKELLKKRPRQPDNPNPHQGYNPSKKQKTSELEL